MATDLRIMAWNANGLLNHQLELQAILDNEKIDVCLISETHFTKQSFVRFRGYKVYQTVHPENAAKGGSAVIIRENILHHEESKYETEHIQATSVNIKTKNYNIILSALYCPPRHAIKKDQYLDFFEKQGYRFIVGGDFNAKNTHWGSRLTTTKGKELLEAVNEHRCEVISTGKPTYWPTDTNKIPDLIDFYIVRNISSNFLHVEEGWDMDSDHSPVLLTMSENIIKKENNPVLVNRFTDWDNFKTSLEAKINLLVPLENTQQLEKEAEQFVQNVQQAAWENTPAIQRRIKGNNYPKEIKELIMEKRKLRKRWQQTRAPEDKTKLNNATQQLKREIQQIKNESISIYLSNLTYDSNTDYSLWKAAKQLKRPVIQSPPIKLEDGSWAKNNKQKAERFAEHLEKIFQPNEGQEEQIDWEEINLQEEEIALVTPKEVAAEIKNNINSKKAPGFDLITGEVLKQLPKKAIVKLTNLINAVFRLQYVPRLWKMAEVIMIPKPGKPPYKASSYRPISLLPVVSKLFEKLLLKRLKPLIEEKELIPTHQFGFRNNHSTIDQVHRITNIIEKSLEEKKVCSTIFLDVAQAFDKVWHKGLIHKLRAFLPKQYIKLLESYISDRYFRVKQEETYSDIKEIRAGVPQGSVLGPVLYLLFTRDIPASEHTTIATFADDTAVLAVGKDNEETAAKLQRAVNQINDWTKKWKIKINESKSVHVDFTNKNIQHIPVNLNNAQIPYSNTAKYLGITLDAGLRWKVHVKKKREELDIKYKKMYWLIGRNSSLSVHNKLMLYKQVIKPVWTYGIQLWGCTRKSNIDIIQRFQNKVLRSIVDAPWYVRNSNLHKDLGMETVDQTIRRVARSHEERLRHHVNVEALQLLDNAEIVRRLKRTKPFELV